MRPLAFAITLTIPWLWSCDSQPTQPSEVGPDPSQPGTLASAALTEQPNRSPQFDPNNFVQTVDNPLFPLRPGTRFVFKGVEDGENEINVTIVTHDRKSILGVSATVVLDRVFVHGELKEKTFDWYAQDKQGNVWYLGENTKEFEDGKVVSTEGSWQAGRDGAKPGIIMLAHPQVGDSYRQEFLLGEAEDQARVVATDIDQRVPYGSFENCIRTVEFTRLEPGVKEAKIFCPGVGFVRAQGVEGPTTRLVLTNITKVSR
ncbi:MAG TPA: hypothetical protein VK899_10895 [Gemmatimonadales bacterium]|nr:hypothetical protein [Gemmatimonadales bacterium]